MTYLGRIVVVGLTPSGKAMCGYRVSSRSFPNRRAVVDDVKQTVSIVPKPGHETDIARNPYIAYNCARVVGPTAILSNGTHTDPLAERLLSGMSPRDALVYVLAALDYEKDSLNTPRIAAVVSEGDNAGWLGGVREDGLDVRRFALRPGECVHLSTYEHNIPSEEYRSSFSAETAVAACEFLLDGGVFAGFTNPVSAVAAVARDDGYDLAAIDM